MRLKSWRLNDTECEWMKNVDGKVCVYESVLFRIQCERSRNQQNGISNSRTLCEPTTHTQFQLSSAAANTVPYINFFSHLDLVNIWCEIHFSHAHSELGMPSQRANSTFWCAELNKNGNFTSFSPYEPTSNFYGAHFTHSKVANARELDTENCLCVSSITLFLFSIRFTCEFNFRTF